MMKNSISILGLLLISGTAFSQVQGKETNVRTVSTAKNGVIASESAGVEGFVVHTPPVQNKPVPVSEWTLEACDNTLYYLEIKINNPKTTEAEKAAYRKQRTQVQLRKQQLQNTGK